MSGDDVRRLTALFAETRCAVAFTGAGVSTESGIPDFRSPGGVWDRFDARELTYQNFTGSREGRRRYWALGRATYPLIRAAAPNAAHLALAALHRLGRLDCCITQNVDNLHQRAGLPADAVIELHGNATRARCLECGAPYTRDELHARLEDGVDVPDCAACGVYPAAYVPAHARRAGATLAIVNLERTPLDREADLVIRARAGQVMAETLDAIRARRARPDREDEAPCLRPTPR